MKQYQGKIVIYIIGVFLFMVVGQNNFIPAFQYTGVAMIGSFIVQRFLRRLSKYSVAYDPRNKRMVWKENLE